MNLKFTLRAAFVFFTTVSTFAGNKCLDLFTVDTHPQKISQVKPGSDALQAPTVRQQILWEQISNQTRWHKPTTPLQISYVSRPKNELTLRVDEELPENVLNFFAKNNQLNWYRHPLNKSGMVPFLNEQASGHVYGQYSASRSLFVNIDGGFFSLKVGTDHPHPSPEAYAQPGKADLLNDSDISMRRSQHIRAYDRKNPHDFGLYVLTEVLSIATKKNGFSVRDLRPLQDGHFYLPAFSIPYAGREIAKKLNVSFEELWNVFYGAHLGRAKALLLLRYGLQMKTPNAQNWLIQLDQDMRPTGRIYMRDVADSNYVDFIAQKNGAKEQLEADRRSDYTVMTDLHPYWENSAWQMDEGGVDAHTLQVWGRSHDKAYIQTIAAGLQIEKKEFKSISELQSHLQSLEGQEQIIQYKKRTKRENKKGALKSLDGSLPTTLKTAKIPVITAA